jgi:hypothetical protein
MPLSRNKQDAFLELDFSFQQGKWILIAFATEKIQEHYTGVNCVFEQWRANSKIHKEG